MRKIIITLGFLGLITGCAKKAVPEAQIKGLAKFQLSGGAAISQPGTDEYNPQVVKMPDSFLVLVFGSNRNCSSCSGHNLFVARSTVAYANNAVFPAFSTPVVFTVGGTPLNLTTTASFATAVSGSNVRIYVTNAAGNIQYGDISPTGSSNVASLLNITNTTWQNAQIVGIDALGSQLFALKSGSLYAFDPAASNATLSAMVTGQTAMGLVNVHSNFSGRSEGYFALVNGSITSMSPYGNGGNLDAVNKAIGKASISARKITSLQTTTRAGDLLFISGIEPGSSTQDLYVVDGLDVANMWDEISPKPPVAPSIGGSSSSSGGGTTLGDGSTWTARTLPSSSAWVSVTYGNGTFVAVAQGTAAATSPDGITWTARTLPSSSFASVTFGGGMFVAVGSGGGPTYAASSPDGITWTPRAIGSPGWSSVTYGNGTFVAVNYNSTTAATSPDGITWTNRTLPGGLSPWRAVAFGNNIFAALCDSNSTIAASSPDGITWTARTLPSAVFWFSATYGNNTFVAVALSAGGVAATSPDGINWTGSTLPSSVNWWSVTYGNNVFVTIANNTASAATSPDGINWTARTLPSTASWSSVAYGNGIFVAIAGGPSNKAVTSP